MNSAFAAGEWKEVVAADGGSFDRLGQAIACSGDLLVAGATGDDDLGNNAGAVYLFDTANATQLRKLRAHDGVAGDSFGASVAVSGTRIAVGAPEDDDAGDASGAVYLFETTRLDEAGYQPMKLVASDAAAGDEFGYSVAIGNGYVVVGAWKDGDSGDNRGAVYIFDASSGAQLRKLTASDAAPSDQFGGAVGISDSFVVVGSPFADAKGVDSGAAYFFDSASGNQLRKITAIDGTTGDVFGAAVSAYGGKCLIGAPGFDSNDSDTELGAGKAYLYALTTGSQVAQLSPRDGAADDRFGSAVALEDLAVIGAFFDDDGASSAGAAYVFDLTGVQKHKLVHPSPASSDFFGQAVAISGRNVSVGVPQDDPSGSSSGSISIFDISGSAPDLVVSISGQDVVLTWIAAPGATYRIHHSSTLATWEPLSGVLGGGSYTHVSALGEPRRFYILEEIK
ncbi:hypothetical protein ACFSSA_01435 [Luteolibacter algae]|uniref:FG-GAP repeat-containing protein n=1 Tax=Luteolibacter algae TaxID=454151 RepID=A0ABW5D6R8_9BACT